MNVRWVDAAETRIEVADETSIRSFPADRRFPEWVTISDAVAAGDLMIRAYEAPTVLPTGIPVETPPVA